MTGGQGLSAFVLHTRDCKTVGACIICGSSPAGTILPPALLSQCICFPPHLLPRSLTTTSLLSSSPSPATDVSTASYSACLAGWLHHGLAIWHCHTLCNPPKIPLQELMLLPAPVTRAMIERSLQCAISVGLGQLPDPPLFYHP